MDNVIKVFGILMVLLGGEVKAQFHPASTKENMFVTNSETECYCYFNLDFSNFMNDYIALQQHLAYQWLEERELRFKEEIENRLNKEFPNYQEAQQDFFKQFKEVTDVASANYNSYKTQLENELIKPPI